MKMLKKLSVLLVVLAMVLNVVGVSAFTSADNPFTAENPFKPTIKVLDANGNEVTGVKAGAVVKVAVYVPAGSYGTMAIAGTLLDTTVFSAPANNKIAYGEGIVNADSITKSRINNSNTSTYGVMLESKEDDDGNMIYIETSADKPICTIELTVGAAAAGALNVMAFYAKDMAANTTDNNSIIVADGDTASIEVLESFVATSAEATVETTYPIGTEVATVLAENAAVTVKGADSKAESGYKATFAAPADFDNTVPGPYKFTGTVTPAANPEDVAASWEGDLTFKLNVTLTALTTGKVTASMDAATIKAEKEARDVTDDELKALFADATFAVAANGIEDTMTVASWAVDKTTLNITEVGTTAKVTATLNTKSAAEKFEFAEAPTVDFTVTVVPAQIAGAKVEVKSANLTTVPQVTITVPASEVNDANEVIVTITDGETTKEQKVEAAKDDFVIDKKGTEDDATDDTAKLVVKFDEKYNKLGYENGDVITVGVTLNGAALADEEGDPLAIKKTVKKPVSNGSPSNVPSSTTKPVVTPEDPTEDPKDEPTTPDEPVVTPDDPGQVPQTEAPFVDVPADHWAAAPVAQLKEAGVVNGSGDGNFAPEADITRAEFTKMVVGVMGLEAAAAEVAFEDCTAEDWFTPYVAAAVEAGLVNGVSETEFAPNATITREQAFAIIGRAIDAEATTAVAFADAADIDEYAAPYVALLVELGIVGGYDDNTIRPDANITRAEAAKLLAGFMDKLNADAEVLPETEEVVEEATEEVVEEEATEEVVEEEATEEVVDEK